MTHCGRLVFATKVGVFKHFNTKQSIVLISFIPGVGLNSDVVGSAHKKEKLDNDKKKMQRRDIYLIFYIKMN